jgi:hypothetical protein
MATQTPIPPNPIGENFAWRDWLQKLSDRVFGTASTLNVPIEPEYGGTGLTTYNAGDLIYCNSTNNLTRLPAPSVSSYLTVPGSGLPTWTASAGIGTVTSVTGTSPVVSSGGTAPAISLAAAYGDTLNPYASKTAKFVLAAPNASNGVPTFRALVASDIPTKSYGAFSDYTSQTIASTTTAYVMTFNTTDLGSNGVSIVSSSRLTVTTTGIYNFQWSGQFESDDNAPQDAYVWIRINGTDVVGSTGRIGLSERKNPGDPFHILAGWNFLLSLTANDYVELVWSATSTSISIKTYAAGTSPTRPTTASLIATFQQL